MTTEHLGRRGKPVTIRGVTYHSQTAAAKALGVSSSAISLARSQDGLARVGLGVFGPVPTPIQKQPADAHCLPKLVRLPKVARKPIKSDPLASIFHPHWSPSDDHALLKARASGDNFTIIADRLGRQRVAVEQRWHRLRIIPEVIKKLEAFGLTSKPYPMNGGLI